MLYPAFAEAEHTAQTAQLRRRGARRRREDRGDMVWRPPRKAQDAEAPFASPALPLPDLRHLGETLDVNRMHAILEKVLKCRQSGRKMLGGVVWVGRAVGGCTSVHSLHRNGSTGGRAAAVCTYRTLITHSWGDPILQSRSNPVRSAAVTDDQSQVSTTCSANLMTVFK